MPLDTPNEQLPEPHALPELREISDARTLRALAHPVRLALIEALGLDGPMTATEVGERIGESPTTCSFHLRQLSKYGFVEEAGGGKGRARPWKVTSIGMHFGGNEDDPESEIAAGALSQLFRERQLDRYWSWRRAKSSFPKAWRDAASDSEYVFFLTADELKELNDELMAFLLPRHLERVKDKSKRPPDSVPVELLLFTYPIDLPAPSGPDAEGGAEA
jgi:DNA-binding transcriptional ArsR family regulator